MGDNESMKKLKLRRPIAMNIRLIVDEKPEEFIVRVHGDRNQELNEIVIENRGEILNAAINIEEMLEEILSKLLKTNNFDSWAFCEKFFVQNNVDFNVKFQMLRALSKTHRLIKKDSKEWKEFRKNLSKVINIRNRFAHGRIIFINEHPHLIYIEGKKQKKIRLANDYWGELEDIFLKTHMQADELTSKLFNYIADEQEEEDES